VSEDRIRLFEALRHRFSPDSDYFAFQRYNLTSVHAWLTGEHERAGVDVVDITLYHPGQVSAPFEIYYGLMSLTDVARLYVTHGKTLVEANIRNYKGSTEVNDRILATIRDEPEYFFYLNNGLTAYCERLEVHNLDRGNIQSKRLTAYGFSIVNGAQTVGSIAAFFASNPQPPPQGYVFLKIISLQRSPDERVFAQRITQSTNFQNQIGLRDFVALDEEQERIATHLELSGIRGFQRCLYPIQKFQSDSERRLAIILDRDALKWFKPARGQFQLYYKLGIDHLEYQPDFVAETVDGIYMLEAKARNDLHDVEVQSKKDAAVQWCSHATRHTVSNGGKPWQYLLIPHDVITENMTIAGLASSFRVD
jgi:AIPR protein